MHTTKSATTDASTKWRLPTGIMKFAGALSPKSARALRRFVQETDKVYEDS